MSTIFVVSMQTSNWSGPLDELGGSTENFFYEPHKAFLTRAEADEYIKAHRGTFDVTEVELIE